MHCDRSLFRKTSARLVACFGVIAVAVHTPCAAQQRGSLSLELNAGASFGDSSVPHGPSRGLSADALLGLRLGNSQSGGFVVAMSGSGQTSGVRIACDLVPGGSCTPNFPTFWMVSALLGWETQSANVRVLVGPALAISDSKEVGAAQARLEIAKPLSPHFALLVSGRVAYIPDHNDSSFTLGAVGVGFRLR